MHFKKSEKYNCWQTNQMLKLNHTTDNYHLRKQCTHRFSARCWHRSRPLGRGGQRQGLAAKFSHARTSGKPGGREAHYSGKRRCWNDGRKCCVAFVRQVSTPGKHSRQVAGEFFVFTAPIRQEEPATGMRPSTNGKNAWQLRGGIQATTERKLSLQKHNTDHEPLTYSL